jgi:wobble nucleotide-excising tRNase
LSEGEKTAIAFLYSLKSLHDKGFKLEEGVVVIDDPVSSLDTNALFHAFSFMKDRTQDAMQLFILTHNHSFFHQVKNWFNHLKGQNKNKYELRPACFYMLHSFIDNKKKVSSIIKLDQLLHKYESEYHYIFSLIYKAAKIDSQNTLEQYYHLPNISRRLLESFLAFRQPKEAGDLRKQLDLVDFDSSKKTRVLRFIHTHSHSDSIDEPEHDLSILSEKKTVLNNILEIMKHEDGKHFSNMVELVDQF